MQIEILIKQLGNQSRVAEFFNVSRAAVSQWVKAGEIPQARLWQLQAGAVKPPERPVEPISADGQPEAKVEA
jgi:DNA-binding transcriptional regulator YdaS (Cro superfamily)